VCSACICYVSIGFTYFIRRASVNAATLPSTGVWNVKRKKCAFDGLYRGVICEAWLCTIWIYQWYLWCFKLNYCILRFVYGCGLLSLIWLPLLVSFFMWYFCSVFMWLSFFMCRICMMFYLCVVFAWCFSSRPWHELCLGRVLRKLYCSFFSERKHVIVKSGIKCSTSLSTVFYSTVGACALANPAVFIFVLNGQIFVCLEDFADCVLCFVGYNQVAFLKRPQMTIWRRVASWITKATRESTT
jgi:hypothetical protein